MPVTSAETAARAVIKAALETEFAAEGFPVYDDHLHESLGWDGKTRIGTSPIDSAPLASNEQVLVIRVKVQFYGKWNKEVDPDQRVDPGRIEEYAERFRRRMQTSDPHTDTNWYIRVRRVAYPKDPTGNMTRFEAEVAVIGNNSALIETVG